MESGRLMRLPPLLCLILPAAALERVTQPLQWRHTAVEERLPPAPTLGFNIGVATTRRACCPHWLSTPPLQVVARRPALLARP